ncbi:MAG: 4-alpha-glucanotransferase, partial [Terrimicrobiaceae bacterium]|nr:4-alpha-glucanotransferase [Terrimicrobiaceae bacterium]
AFTERWGQNWGFPLYNWERMSRDNFRWWRRRLRALFRLFHFLRVDHALGFFRIYSFPWRPEENERFTHLSREEAAGITGGELPRFIERGDDTPEDREYNRQHGEMVLRVFLEEAPAHRLIAEDLGEVAPYVRPTLAALEIPGFKIPQWERRGAGLIPGEEYPRLSVATFATHDHPPIRAMWEELFAACADPREADASRAEQRALLDFCGRPDIAVPSPYTREIHHAFLSGLLACNSWVAIHMITDLFGSAERFNVPGSAAGENWTRRIAEPVGSWNDAHEELLKWFRKAVKASGRAP